MGLQKNDKYNIYNLGGIKNFGVFPKSRESELTSYGGAFTDRSQTAFVNDAYFDAMNRSEYFQVIWGGSGGGKSEWKAFDLLLECLTKPYFRCMFARKFSSTVRSTQFQLFKDIINRHSWHDLFKINEVEMVIKCKYNNNYLRGMGLDDVHKLTSLPAYSCIWLEEPLSKTKNASEDIQEKEFMELIRRLRGTNEFKVSIHFTFNPVSKLSWIYNLFFNDDKESENYDSRYELFKDRTYTLKTTYLDNFYIDRDEYLKSLNLNDAYDFKIFAHGEWGIPKADTPAFWNWEHSKHVGNCKEIDYNLPIYLSFDQNIGIMATTVIQWSKERKKIWIRRELPKSQDNVSLKDKLINSDILIKRHQNILLTGDASGKSRHHMNNETFYDYMLRELRIEKSNLKCLEANLDHFDSLNNINRALIEYEIIVDKSCVNVISDMQSTNKTSENKIDKKSHDPHFVDCIRYFIDSIVYRKQQSTFKYY